jgi:hypothetical protein
MNFIAAMQTWGGIFIFCLLLLIAFSILMVYGIAKSNRGMMIPWLASMGIAILFQLIFGLWLLGGYYIYVSFYITCLSCDLCSGCSVRINFHGTLYRLLSVCNCCLLSLPAAAVALLIWAVDREVCVNMTDELTGSGSQWSLDKIMILYYFLFLFSHTVYHIIL